MGLTLPEDKRSRTLALVLILIVAVGAGSLGSRVGGWLYDRFLIKAAIEAAKPAGKEIPISKMPGPARTEAVHYVLGDDAPAMVGRNDPENERWADLAGNFYTHEFVRNFDYENPGPDGPIVRIHIEPSGDTLAGRLEAHGLKPNFGYQIKLMGDFHRDREGFEFIGAHGRWRLPGKGTNYTDLDYLRFPDKDEVEAYLLFDYFVTDQQGNAVRNFSLDSCLHVLWNATRQGGKVRAHDVYEHVCHATDPKVYSRPKDEPTIEGVWAERERRRYGSAEDVVRLPPRHYRAILVLTEESWHSNGRDGGWWATPLALPIEFEITAPPEDEQADENDYWKPPESQGR